ncbi:MAG TPA: hypothetical protein VFG04_14090 [Planctomycetaceae bacterium]|jgi:hypothetical protein|nr:hypothetical protein [Planctomycetaceae bacterium]
MTTWDNTGAGGVIFGGKAYVSESRVTQNPPCGCCRNILCSKSVNDSGLLPFPLPLTWTFTIPSDNETCCAFNETFELYYSGTITQLGNQNQPGVIAGCFLSWSGPNTCNGPNGFGPMSLVLSGLGPPSYPVGTVAAVLTIGTGFQNVAYESLHFQDGTFILDTLIGTSESCSLNFGGSWNDTLVPTHTAFPVFTYQTVRHPCTPSTNSPNGSFVIGYQGGAVSTNNFTYDTSSGDFSGTISTGGTFTGTFNFTTGQIVITTAGNLFTSSQSINCTVQYSTPSDYPASITLEPQGELDCPSCSDAGNTCNNFQIIVTKDLVVAGGPTVHPGAYSLILGTGYTDVAGAGYTSIGCGVCQWNQAHFTGGVGWMMTQGTLSYGINPTVAQITASAPTHRAGAASAFECLWVSYMEWDIDTDSGLPKCCGPTVIADGLTIWPSLNGGGGQRRIWKPRIGGGVNVGGMADESYVKGQN